MIFLTWHLGLGDAIVCNGLVNHLAKKASKLVLPYKHHNRGSVEELYGHLPNVKLLACLDDKQMYRHEARYIANGYTPFRLGIHLGKEFDPIKWDLEFYRQAGINSSIKVSGFKYVEQFTKVKKPSKPYIFVHDDAERGFKIEIQSQLRIVRPHRTTSILEWLDVMKNAKEIHCIDSSFMCLADIAIDNDQKLVCHKYARASNPISVHRNWQILDAKP